MQRSRLARSLRFAVAALAALCAVGIAAQGDRVGTRAPAPSDGLVSSLGTEGLDGFAPVDLAAAVDRVAHPSHADAR